MRYSLIPIIAAASLIITGCSPSSEQSAGVASSPAARKVKIELASYLPATTHIVGEHIMHISEELDKVSGGNIDLEVFDAGALVGPLEILDAVSDGKVDAGYGSSGFWMGKIPSAPIFTAVPFGPSPTEFVAWLYHGNGMDLYQEMYDQAGFNVKVLVCGMIPPETSGWFAKEINGPEDLKNLKMRFFGLGGLVMGKLGVSVSVLPGAEIFPALEKGVIDATEYALPSVDANQGFHKVVKYNYFPGWHQQATLFELLINKDVWENLSETQQAQIESVSRAGIIDHLSYGDAIQARAIKENVEKHGVIVKDWSPEMLDLFRKTWEEVVQEQAAKDAFFKKVWDDLSAFRAEYATWGERGYLK